MAAHAITALSRLRDDMFKTQSVNWPGLQAATNLSCWTELLSLDDFSGLDGIVKEQNILKLVYWIGEVYDKYFRIWECLGKPTTMEEWVHRSWLDICAEQVVTKEDALTFHTDNFDGQLITIPANTMLWVQMSDAGVTCKIVDGEFENLCVAACAVEKVEGPHVF